MMARPTSRQDFRVLQPAAPLTAERCRTLGAWIESLSDGGRTAVVVDLSCIAETSSIGGRAFGGAVAQAAAHGAKVVVCGVGKALGRTLKASGLAVAPASALDWANAVRNLAGPTGRPRQGAA